MKRSRFLVVALILVHFITVAAVAQRGVEKEGKLTTPATSNGRVSGVVFDVNDARVVGATVIVKGSNLTREVTTSDVGKFEVSVGPGEYSFVVMANGFCKFESEPLRVSSNVTELIGIHLEVAVTHKADACRCSARRTN